MTQVTEKAAVTGREQKAGLTGSARIFPLPPENFDPMRASDATLRYHGLHSRADAKPYPRLAARLEEIYSKKLRFIQPEFDLGISLDPIPSLNPEPWWSGSSVETGTASPIRLLYGKFTVATVRRRPVALDQYVDTWLGVGGLFGRYLCRAGVRQEVTTTIAYDSFNFSYTLFMQWGDQPVKFIRNFPTNPGDQIEIFLCVRNTPATEGYFVIYNDTQLTHMTYPFEPPAGETINNQCADWIVSRPGYIVEEALLPQPALFDAIQFDDAVAFTDGGNEIGAGAGRLFNYSEFGRPATRVEVISDTSIRIVAI